MRPRTTIPVLALMLLLAACDGGPTGTTLNPPHGTTTAPATTADENPTGIVGSLRMQGGPRPGIDEPTSGRIAIWKDDRRQLVIHVPDTGAFTADLPPGRYRVIATFGRRLPCEEQTVTVPEDEIIDITIICNIR